jgi:hypothetical protein
VSEQREHRPARHQPQDAEHGCERREAERNQSQMTKASRMDAEA